MLPLRCDASGSNAIAVERGGLAQDAREGVLLGSAEVQPDTAGDAGQVVEARNLVGEADRLDDVEPRARIAAAAFPTCWNMSGSSAQVATRLPERTTCSFGPTMLAEKNATVTGDALAAEALHQAAQRIERASRAAGHLVRRSRPGWPWPTTCASEARTFSCSVVRLDSRAAVRHRDERDAIGRHEVVEERVGGLAQRALGADAERIVVHDQHECARLLRICTFVPNGGGSGETGARPAAGERRR